MKREHTKDAIPHNLLIIHNGCGDGGYVEFLLGGCYLLFYCIYGIDESRSAEDLRREGGRKSRRGRTGRAGVEGVEAVVGEKGTLAGDGIYAFAVAVVAHRGKVGEIHKGEEKRHI